MTNAEDSVACSALPCGGGSGSTSAVMLGRRDSGEPGIQGDLI